MSMRKKAILKLLLYLFSSTVLTTTLFLSSTYNQELDDQNKQITNKIEAANLQIADIQKKEMMLATNLDLWKKISSTNMHSSGYITNFNILLNELYQEYHILKPEIFISRPQEAEMPYKSKYVKVIKSRINLYFSSVSDKNVFLFTDALNTLPGYVIIKSFSLVKEKEITPEIIDHSANGSFIATVTGRITFDWYSLLRK